MTLEELQNPPTEIEIGRLLTAMADVMTPNAVAIVRRLAFQRNLLLQKLTEQNQPPKMSVPLR